MFDLRERLFWGDLCENVIAETFGWSYGMPIGYN